jgi:hypothetical protein
MFATVSRTRWTQLFLDRGSSQKTNCTGWRVERAAECASIKPVQHMLGRDLRWGRGRRAVSRRKQKLPKTGPDATSATPNRVSAVLTAKHPAVLFEDDNTGFADLGLLLLNKLVQHLLRLIELERFDQACLGPKLEGVFAEMGQVGT